MDIEEIMVLRGITMDFNNTSATKASQRIRDMVQIALLTAITYLAANFIQIPYGTGGVVHLGDSIIFIAAMLFGTRQAVISGAIGMAMFDGFSPYAAYAPYTFVIKAVMALIIGLIANSGGAKGNSAVKNVIGVVLAGAWGVAGYFGAEIIMYQNVLAAAGNVLGNVIQVTAGGAIALVALPALKRTRYFGSR
jgi:uncharacterized membrane protein